MLLDRPAILAVSLVAIVFAVDLALPLGVAAAVPYTFAVLLALKSRTRSLAVWIASANLTNHDLIVRPTDGVNAATTNPIPNQIALWIIVVPPENQTRGHNPRRL